MPMYTGTSLCRMLCVISSSTTFIKIGTWSQKLNGTSQDVFNGTGYCFNDMNGLFNHAVNTSYYTVSSDGMINE